MTPTTSGTSTGFGGSANSGGSGNSGGSTNQAGNMNSGGAGGSQSGLDGAATDAAGGARSIDAARSDSSPPSDSGTLGSCTTAGTELCDDFESGQLDLQKWKLNKPTASASITVDGAHVHGGMYALHVQVVPGQQSTAMIADAVTFPAASNTFYTRAFVYFTPDLPADMVGGFHMAYLLATGNNDLGFVEAGLGSAGNKQYLGYSEYYGAGPGVHAHGATFTEFGPRSTLQVVPMKWICLELMQGGDATTTTRQVWVEGNELMEQRSSYNGRLPPKFDLVSIGVLQYHPTTILSDVWFDDVRVSKQRIGCEN
jgi:hypothetical protein